MEKMRESNVPFDLKQIDEESPENFTVSGILAAYGNTDLCGDRIKRGAFKNFLRSTTEETVPLCWAHDHAVPLGIMPVKKMKETKTGLLIEALMPREDTFVKDRVMPQLRIGSVKKMSIGYKINDYCFNGKIRDLTDLHLFEGSLVPIPMNPNANILSVKSVVPYADLPLADDGLAWDGAKARRAMLELAGGDLDSAGNQRKYRRGFFWYDSESPDVLASYKLPYAAVINGRLTAVPRGIMAAAGAMGGARSMPDIPAADRPGVIRNIEKYYKKMDRESPFEKTFRLDDLKNINPRDLEQLFRDGVRFSRRKSKQLVSIFKENGLCEASCDPACDETELLKNELDKILMKMKGKNRNG